ncbi:unnamed protein product [Heligmosomoides polygyrus]|uniref:Acyl-CoA_dh_N domain-containing protein n=1 Tax=Heligmosomoides polygyrus TaxID=6339 RepID=A0A3P7XNS8_HELPZ|nr:unnamed protein product [Heligmosomoides polygyrus]
MRPILLDWLRRKSLSRCAARFCSSKEAMVPSTSKLQIKPLAMSDIPVEKASLSRGLIMNKFEKDFLIYPEYTDTDDVKTIQGFTEVLKKTLALTVDREELEKEGSLTDAVKGALNDSTIFAALSPSQYGGLGLGFKDRVKVFEDLSIDWNIFANVESVNALVNTLLLFGSEQLKEKYFPLITAGKLRPLIKEKHYSCYLIDRSELGENDKWEFKRDETTGLKAFDGRQLLTVYATLLGNWEIPVYKAQAQAFLLFRSLFGHLNPVLQPHIQHNAVLSDESGFQYAATEFALKVYILESAAYYMAGLLDEHLPVVLDIENALIHLTRDVLRHSIITSVDLAGLRAIDPAFHFEKDMRDVTTLLSRDESIVESVAIAALSSWSSVGHKRITNSLKRLFRQEKLEDELRNPKLTHYVAEHAHPSLQMACQDLEFSLSRVNNVISKLIAEKGKNVQEDFSTLERLVTVIQNHLVMVAVISRSSRSYSIGLRNSDIEIAWATFICSRASRENWFLLEALNDYFGLIRLNPSLLNVGKAIFDMGGYQIESPIERNW